MHSTVRAFGTGIRSAPGISAVRGAAHVDLCFPNPEVMATDPHPLGAGRLTREWLADGRGHEELRLHARSVIADVAGPLLRGGEFDRAVATSKTFRSLARIAVVSAKATIIKRPNGIRTVLCVRRVMRCVRRIIIGLPTCGLPRGRRPEIREPHAVTP